MNLKERGVTVGDLLVIIIIISSIFIIQKLNKDKKTSVNLLTPETTYSKLLNF